MDIAQVFTSLRPGASFKGNEVNFHSIETIEQTFVGDMPTPTEMAAEWDRLQGLADSIAYRDKRRAEMPPIADVVDAICKGQETGDWSEFDTMQAARNAIKDKHPKPENV